jgi:hypothetical protein
MSDISNMSDSTTDIVIRWVDNEEESIEIITQEEYNDFDTKFEYNDFDTEFEYLVDYVVLGTVESYTQQYLDEMDDIIDDVQEFQQSEYVQQFINHYKKIICSTNRYDIVLQFLSEKHDPISNIESDLHILINYEGQYLIKVEQIKHFITIVDKIRSNFIVIMTILHSYQLKLQDYEDNKFILYLAIDNYHYELKELRSFKDMCVEELKYHPRHVEVMLENENGFELLGY